MKRYSNHGTEVCLTQYGIAMVKNTATALLDAADMATDGSDAMRLERVAVGFQAFLLDTTPPIVPVDRSANAS